MTIPEQQTRYIYSGPYVSGDTLPIPFDYAEEMHVKVTKNDQLLRFNIDYRVQGNNVILQVVISSEDKVVVYRDTTIDNQADFPQEALFDSEKIEDALDKLTMQNQEQADAIDRCFKLATSATTGTQLDLPDPINNRCLKWYYDGEKYKLVNSDKDPDLGGGGSVDAYTKAETNALLNKKQNTLIPGPNITISGNVISSTGGGSAIDTEARAMANEAKELAEAAYASTSFSAVAPLALDKTGDVQSVGWAIDNTNNTAVSTIGGAIIATTGSVNNFINQLSGVSSDGKAFLPGNALYFPRTEKTIFMSTTTDVSGSAMVAGVLRSNGYFEPRYIFSDPTNSYYQPLVYAITRIFVNTDGKVAIEKQSVGTRQVASVYMAGGTTNNLAAQLDCSGSAVYFTRLKALGSGSTGNVNQYRWVFDTQTSDRIKECNVVALISTAAGMEVKATSRDNVWSASVDESWYTIYQQPAEIDKVLASLRRVTIPSGVPTAGLSLMYDSNTLGVNSNGQLFAIGAGSLGFPNYSVSQEYENNTEYQVAEPGFLMWNSIDSTDDGETTVTITYNGVSRTFITKSSSEDRDDTKLQGTYPLPRGARFRVYSQDRGTLVPVQIYYFPALGEQS